MNKRLWWALALVLGLTLWLAQADDEALLARPDRPREGARQGADRTPAAKSSREDRLHAVAPAGRASGPAHAVEGDALMASVVRWQSRVRTAPTASAPRDSAWEAARPPAPPPVRVVKEAPPPPPPPMAPRFPHAWVGRFNDEALPGGAASGASAPAAVARAVVTGPQTTWVVREGDVIEGQWRIDRIQDRTMSLTYLPLQQQQTVAMR